jgi:hypothetical protein
LQRTVQLPPTTIAITATKEQDQHYDNNQYCCGTHLLIPFSLGVTPAGLTWFHLNSAQFQMLLASNELAQLKHDARLTDVDVKFMLCRIALEDACEIKHDQDNDQTQYNGQDGQGTAGAPGIGMNLYDSICQSFQPPFLAH